MKKAIIIAVVIVLVAVVAIGVLFFLKNQAAPTGTGAGTDTGLLPGSTGGNTGTQQSSTTNNSGNTSGAIPFGDAAVTSADITPGAPADAPQGPTLQFQTASGTITLNNFYNSAQGYWVPFDMLLIQSNSSYAIWYYRDSSEFEIDIPVNGTFADEDDAASHLSGILGVGQQELCSLPVSAVFEIDQGNDNEVYPLNFCSTSTL